MNCRCKPAIPAITRTSNSAKNQSRVFFCCANNQCDFFCWADSIAPPPSVARMNGNGSTRMTKKSSYQPRIAILRFETQPWKVWLHYTDAPSARLLALFNQLPAEECHYLEKVKMWEFSFEAYDRVVSTLESNEGSTKPTTVDVLPRFLVSGMKSFLQRVSMIPPITDILQQINIIPSLRQTLFPFQLEGIKFVIDRGGRALIGDEMGCGKTVQAIGVLQHYRKHWPALIIVPTNLIDQWKKEIMKYCDDLVGEAEISVVRKATDKTVGKIVIIAYSVIDRVAEKGKITPDMFGVVIADESHNLKTPNAKRTVTVLPFLKKAKVAVCLSGTPALNRPIELFTTLNALLPDFFSNHSYDQFATRYCDAKPSRFSTGLDVNGSSNESELKMLLTSMVMIRRMKDDIVKGLPDKVRHARSVEPDPKYVRQLFALHREMEELEEKMKDTTLDTEEKSSIKNRHGRTLNQYCKVTGLSKIDAVKNELTRLIGVAKQEGASKLQQAEQSKQPAASSSGPSASSSFTLKAVAEVSDEMEVVDLCYDNKYGDMGLAEAKEVEREAEKMQEVVNEDEIDLVDSSEDERQANIPSYSTTPRRKKLRRMNELPDNEDDLYFDEKALAQPARKELTDLFTECVDEDNKSDSGSDDNNDIEEDAIVAESGIDSDEEEEFDFFAPNKSKRKIAATKTASSKKATKGSSAVAVAGKSTLGKKILVFAHHHEVLDAIENVCRVAELGYVRIDGKVTGPKKTKYIDRFATEDNLDVAILAITACGTGLNLTMAEVALFAELNWSPGVVLQAEDRIHRIGQTAAEVNIVYILAKNSGDDIMWDRLHHKQNTLDDTIGGGGKDKTIASKAIRHGDNSKSSQSHSSNQHKISDFLPTNVPPMGQAPVSFQKPSLPSPSKANFDTFAFRNSPNKPQQATQQAKPVLLQSQKQGPMDNFLVQQAQTSTVSSQLQPAQSHAQQHMKQSNAVAYKLSNPYEQHCNSAVVDLVNSNPQQHNNHFSSSSVYNNDQSVPQTPPVSNQTPALQAAKVTMGGVQLTDEMREKIERNRREALKKRQERLRIEALQVSAPLPPSVLQQNGCFMTTTSVTQPAAYQFQTANNSKLTVNNSKAIEHASHLFEHK